MTLASSQSLVKAAALLLIVLIVLAALTLALHTFVTSQAAFGIDFYVFWLAGKEVFLSHGNPYGEAVTSQAQLAVYGRPAVPGENYMMFANPPYSLLVILPSIWMSYPLAQAFWIALNTVFLIVAGVLAFPRVPVWAVVTLPFLYPVARGLIMGQFSPGLAAVSFGVYALLIKRKKAGQTAFFLAGLLLAWLTIKPQLTWLLILFFLGYAIRRKDWSVLGGFAAGVIGLIAIGWLLVPGWPALWLAQAASHAENRVLQPGILLWASWVSPLAWIRLLAVFLLGLSLFTTAYIALQWWRGKAATLLLLGAVSLLTLIVHPLYLPPAQVVLILPLLGWISQPEVRATVSGKLTWLLALVLPWLIFYLNFHGVEPYAISIYTPLLFLLWLFWVYVRPESQTSGSTLQNIPG